VSLLTAQNLTLKVGERSLCEGLSLSLRAGECWGILGPNGSGKTTLLHTLAGLHPPEGGHVVLNGRPINELPRRLVAQQLGLLLQDSQDPFPATVEETALSGRHPYLGRWQAETAADRRRAQAALERMELTGMSQRMVQTLSGGERRRLALATLLTQDAPLILLDEPFNHLDLRHQQLLLASVRELCSGGHGVMMVLHDPNQAIGHCHHVLMLDGNGGWQAGEAETLLTAERLSALYGCPVEESEQNGRRWFNSF